MDIKEEMMDSHKVDSTESSLDLFEPKRFLLYDNLIVDIVDFDEEDGAPIVEFSMCPSDEIALQLPVECGICPDVMHRKRLDKHVESHIKYVEGNKRFGCIYCHEHFATRAFAAGHLRRHEGIRPYVCEECKIYYCTKEDMKMHKRRRHSAKNHICEKCGKTFTLNSTLRNHILSVHEQLRRFPCEHCGKKFLRRYTMREHIRNVHLLDRRPLRCKFCDKDFNDAHKLAQHRKEEHLQQSSFECHTCGVEFNNVEFFDAHKRSIQCRNKSRLMDKATEDQEDKEDQFSDTEAKAQDGYIEVQSQDIMTADGVLTLHDNGHVIVKDDDEIIYEISVDEYTEI